MPPASSPTPRHRTARVRRGRRSDSRNVSERPGGSVRLAVRGKQFWLGPARAGVTVTFWADHDVIHLSIAGARVKTLRSHLSTTDLAALAATGARPAGPSPLPPTQPGAALEVDRTISCGGLVALGKHRLLAAEILSGRRISIRIEAATLMFFDPDTRELLRTRPNPLSYDQARTLRGARPAGPLPRPRTEPVTVQRRPSATGVIVVAGQKLALGRTHAHTIVTVHAAEHTITHSTQETGCESARSRSKTCDSVWRNQKSTTRAGKAATSTGLALEAGCSKSWSLVIETSARQSTS